MIIELLLFRPDQSTQKHYIGQAGDDGSVVKIECSGATARVYLDSGICYSYSGIPFEYIERDELQPFKINPEFVHIVVNYDRNVDDCIEGVFMYPDDAENMIESLNDQKAFPDNLGIKTARIERKVFSQE